MDNPVLGGGAGLISRIELISEDRLTLWCGGAATGAVSADGAMDTGRLGVEWATPRVTVVY